MKIDFPKLIYYDQDFLQLYKKTWQELEDFWRPHPTDNKLFLFCPPEAKTINQYDTIMASFALVYQNKPQYAAHQMDFFYQQQEENGAIRANYDIQTQESVTQEGNPENLNAPVFAWVEFHLFHKVGLKKRIQEVFPKLERYFQWVDRTFRDEKVGLLHAPLEAMHSADSPRKEDGAYYLIDLNAQQLLNAHYMAILGDLLNDKEVSFRYRKYFFSLKTRIMKLMWDPKTNFFYDLDPKQKIIPSATLASYWLLLCDMLNEDRLEHMVSKLQNPKWFGSENPFPSLAQHHPKFSRQGHGGYGSVYPRLNFMVIKGLEAYQYHRLAREYAILHMYHLIDTYCLESEFKHNFWEAYMPFENRPALRGPVSEKDAQYISGNTAYMVASCSIVLLIETIIGFNISLPRKTVDWTVPILEEMGIRNLLLRRNIISIQTRKSSRGWEIRLESEKLYYFTVDILDYKRKTLPIPSGKCSMLVDKL